MFTRLAVLLLFCPTAAFSVSQTDSLYLKGHAAFTEGRFTDARNAWFKYLRLRAISADFSEDKQWREIQEKIIPLNDQLRVKPTPLPVQIEVISHKPKAPKKKQSLSSRDILKKARHAQRNGQLDSALRFYKLAAKVDPVSPEIQMELSSLEKEME